MFWRAIFGDKYIDVAVAIFSLWVFFYSYWIDFWKGNTSLNTESPKYKQSQFNLLFSAKRNIHYYFFEKFPQAVVLLWSFSSNLRMLVYNEVHWAPEEKGELTHRSNFCHDSLTFPMHARNEDCTFINRFFFFFFLQFSGNYKKIYKFDAALK